jgi:hypothetical protein
MKELLTVNANFHAVWTDGDKRQLPQVEVILVMSEPTYAVDAVGEIIRQRETSQCRFSASPKLLRKLAESLNKLADEADALPVANKELCGGGPKGGSNAD